MILCQLNLTKLKLVFLKSDFSCRKRKEKKLTKNSYITQVRLQLKFAFRIRLFNSTLGTRASAENFLGGGGNGKRPKISKQYRKIALFSIFRGRRAMEKRPKNSKKDRKKALLSLFQEGGNGKKTENLQKKKKIALLSLYLPYLYHVWKSKGRGHGHLPMPMGGGLFSANIFRTRGRGFFRCGRLHFLAQKFSDFFKFMMCRTDKGEGVEHVRTFFSEKRRGQFSAILCGRLLLTAPYNFTVLFSRYWRWA